MFANEDERSVKKAGRFGASSLWYLYDPARSTPTAANGLALLATIHVDDTVDLVGSAPEERDGELSFQALRHVLDKHPRLNRQTDRACGGHALPQSPVDDRHAQ